MDKVEERSQPRRLSPAKFRNDIVNFFQSLDMGSGTTKDRFQDEPEFEVFFKHGISNIIILNSLKNVYVNNYRSVTRDHEGYPKLSEGQRILLEPILNTLGTEEVKSLDKHWLTIFSHYKIKDEVVPEEFNKDVEVMGEILLKNNILFQGVEKDARALKYIEDQSEELCLKAVKKFGCALEYVKHQTPEICMEAVKQDGYALKFVKEQTPVLCLAAVQQDVYALKFVKV